MGDLLKTPFSEVNATLEVLEHLGVAEEHLKRIRVDKPYAECVALCLIRGEVTLDVYPITVDYSMTLKQMIEAGRYDWVNSDITSKIFPVKGKGIVNLDTQLVHFRRDMSSEPGIAEMDKMGLRPATHAELLAFGAKYPEFQRQFPIVALGSSDEVLGDRSVLYLCSGGRGRSLNLSWFGGDWGGSFRFLAVRK